VPVGSDRAAPEEYNDCCGLNFSFLNCYILSCAGISNNDKFSERGEQGIPLNLQYVSQSTSYLQRFDHLIFHSLNQKRDHFYLKLNILLNYSIDF